MPTELPIIWREQAEGRCDLGYPDAEPCNLPVRFIAFAACPPSGWGPAAPAASVGGYCSHEHAKAEQRPTLGDVEHVFAVVHDVGDRESKAGWRALIDSFPDPLPVAPTAP